MKSKSILTVFAQPSAAGLMAISSSLAVPATAQAHLQEQIILTNTVERMSEFMIDTEQAAREILYSMKRKAKVLAQMLKQIRLLS